MHGISITGYTYFYYMIDTITKDAKTIARDARTYVKNLLLRSSERTKEILQVNPTLDAIRKEPENARITVYQYNGARMNYCDVNNIEECKNYKSDDTISWINIDGIRRKDVEDISDKFGVDPLLEEDILSVGQRPKMDEIEPVIYCLLNMLYFNEETSSIDQEQISIILGKNFVISFQDDAEKDVFNSLREKLKMPQSRVRNAGADYLCYMMIDMIVDHYYLVLEKLGDKIENTEEHIIEINDPRSLVRINALRKELIVLKRNLSPVRDLVNAFMRSDSELLDDRINKYFKDVYDHIAQANDLMENYRDMVVSLQDLYLNKANMKMNEAMKVMAIVTCLLAPATVIGGIFGMNFDRIPYLHNQYGFAIAVALMLLIPVYMIRAFKRRGWF